MTPTESGVIGGRRKGTEEHNAKLPDAEGDHMTGQ